MINVEDYLQPTEEEREEHFKELDKLCNDVSHEGDIYLKICCDIVIDATVNFEKAYNWFYEDDTIDIQVWSNGVDLLIHTEELLDVYNSFGFDYALDYN